MLKILDNTKLWWFAGEDPYILGQCSKGLRRRFSLIGLLVICLSIVAAASLTYGIDQILESAVFDVIIGLYWGFFVFVLYLFALYTFSKNVLPSGKNSWTGKFLSFGIRIGFLAFLGFLVAQPLTYCFLQTPVDLELSVFKKEEIANEHAKLNLKYAQLLQDKRPELKTTVQFKKQIQEYNRFKNRELRGFIKSQDERNFFIRKIIVMNTQGSVRYISWLFSLVLVLIFILPVGLKFLVSLSTDYYRTKKRIQTRLIDSHHSRMVRSYNFVMQAKYGHAGITFSSAYIDPPYNTTLKSKPREKDKSEFLKWLLLENN